MLPIKVKANPIFPIVQLIAGVFILITAIIIGDLLQLVMGSFFILIGVLFLTQPVLVVTNTEIQLRNMIGMTLKKAFHQKQNITFDENKLMVDGKRFFVGSAFNSKKADFAKVKTYFMQRSQDPNLEKHLVD